MNVLLLLGSGVSMPAGLPSVRQITDSIFLHRWLLHQTGRFLSFEIPAETFESPADTIPWDSSATEAQRFLRLLKSYADGYYALRSNEEATYEDLYFLSHQLTEHQTHLADNPAIDSFIREIHLRYQQSKPPNPLGISRIDTQGMPILASDACKLISCAVWNALKTPAQISGLDSLIELANEKNISRIDIVTLNHDLLIETLLQQQGIEYVDGFSAADGNIRYFSPELFETNAKIRLFKLHGSIDWFRVADIDYTNIRSRYGRVTTSDWQNIKDGAGNLLHISGAVPQFLAGTGNKFASYGSGIFSEQWYWFHRLLKEHTQIIASGYGWGDRGVNSKIADWLNDNPTSRLVILNKRGFVEFDHRANSPRFLKQDAIPSYVQRRKLTLIQKWFCELAKREIVEIATR